MMSNHSAMVNYPYNKRENPVSKVYIVSSAETMQYKDVLKSIIPIRNLFATVFFVTIGLVIDPSVILSVLPIALLISIVAIFSKTLIFTFILMRFQVPLREAPLCGLATGPRGEISLIISQTANVSGIVGSLFLGIAASLVLLTSFFSSIFMLVLNFIMKRKKPHAPAINTSSIIVC